MLTLIRCPFHPCITEVARKRPRSFCQKCRWQIIHEHVYTLVPTKSKWADCRWPSIVWEPIRDELTRNLTGNIRPQSSQYAEPLWTDPALKSGISVCELISKAQAWNEWSNILPKYSQSRNEPPLPYVPVVFTLSSIRTLPTTIPLVNVRTFPTTTPVVFTPDSNRTPPPPPPLSSCGHL